MKLKIGLIFTLLVSLCSVSQGRNYGAAGCGPGSMLVGANGNQFLAMLIDDAFFIGYIQGPIGTLGAFATVKTYAITSGTSNCKDDGVALGTKEQEQYVEANYESLMQEISQGQGEHLSAFQAVLQCDGSASQEFSAVMQKKYGDIFPTSQSNSLHVLKSVKNAIKGNTTLTQSCKLEEV